MSGRAASRGTARVQPEHATVDWTDRFEEDGPNVANYVLNDGTNAVVVGQTHSDGEVGTWLIEFTPEGDIVREETVHRQAPEETTTIAHTSDGGYITCGKHQIAAGGQGAFIRKLDNEWNVEWEYSDSEYEGTAVAAFEAIDGGVIAGIKRFGTPGGNNSLLWKFSADGTREWNTNIGPDARVDLDALLQDSTGTIVATSTVDQQSDRESSNLYTVVKGFNTDGSPLWESRIGDPDVFAVIDRSTGGYALAGRSDDGAMLLFLDEQGSEQSRRTYDQMNYAIDALQTETGDYVLCGGTDPGAVLLQTDNQGRPRWTKTYTTETAVNPFDFTRLSDGGYMLVGEIEANSDDSSAPDAWLLKTAGRPSQTPPSTERSNPTEQPTESTDTTAGNGSGFGLFTALLASFTVGWAGWRHHRDD